VDRGRSLNRRASANDKYPNCGRGSLAVYGEEDVTEQQTFQFTNMMSTILFIVLLVLSVEIISQRTRSYLREGDNEEQLSLYQRIVGFPKRMSNSLLK